VFRSNSNNSVINSTKHNFVYLTSEHIRYLVSNEGSPATACRNNFTFCITELLKCVNLCCAVCRNLCCAVCHNLCCAVCHNLCCAVCRNFCYSYSQSVATFSALIAPSIHRTISILYSTTIIQSVCSTIFTYC